MAARKSPLRLVARPRCAAPVANDAPDAAVASNIAHGNLALATAALLPLLDATAAKGHAPSRLAAELLRALTEQAAARDAGAAPPEAQMAAAVERLTRLARAQDTHLAQLQAMLDASL